MVLLKRSRQVTFQTHLAIGLIPEVTGLEVTRMGANLSAAVALDADITAGVTGLA